MRSVALAAVALVGGCYHPSLESCQYACAAGDTPCPSGLECSAGMCVVHGDSCGLVVDAQPDAKPDAPPTPGCVWPAQNVVPCNLNADQADGDWDLTQDTTINTGALGVTDPFLVAGMPLLGNSSLGKGLQNDTAHTEAAILVVKAFKVESGFTLTVKGDRPLIIVTQQANVLGTIVATTTASCATGNGQDGGAAGAFNSGNGGGGGGSYGAVNPGAAGGAGVGTSPGGAGGAGTVGGNSGLTPLRGGCPGGTGAPTTAGGHDGPTGGLGGGAIQISSFTTITITGTINVGGKGGTAGRSGAGGGAGGAILLDSIGMINVTNASLCANGGGGGGVGGLGNANFGSDATCIGAVGAAGGNATGGAGAAGNVPASAGSPGTGGSFLDGSGGGGGCGLIHFIKPALGTPTTITPAQTMP